jgi:hypothetical protein
MESDNELWNAIQITVNRTELEAQWMICILITAGFWIIFTRICLPVGN